jgi:hypothetical protein
VAGCRRAGASHDRTPTDRIAASGMPPSRDAHTDPRSRECRDHLPIGRSAAQSCSQLPAHNRLVAGSSPAGPTTHSRANRVSCGLLKNPLCSASLAGVGEAFPVSAAGEGGLRVQNAARSLARANPFPVDFVPTDRDGFACRLRPVRIRGRWASEHKGRRSVTTNLNEKSNEAAQRRQGRGVWFRTRGRACDTADPIRRVHRSTGPARCRGAAGPRPRP